MSNLVIFLKSELKKFVVFLILWSVLCSPYALAQDGMMPLVGENKYHIVQAGEDLYPIAKKYGLAIEHVMWANGLKGVEVAPGTRLLIPGKRILPDKIYEGLIVNLPERGIYLFREGSFVKFYPIAIGSAGSKGKWMTPTGEFSIINKVKDPTWLPPEWAKEEKPVQPGPDNPLGDRWIGLNEPGLGIHATNSPVSVGLAVSHGCMRMYPESAHDLFERVYEGMTVRIIYQPVKVGYDEKAKRIYMEVYGDVYEKTTGLKEIVREKIASLGLIGLMEEKLIDRLVEEQNGLLTPVLGSDIVIKVNDKKLNFFFSPIMKDGKIWVTSEVLKPMGSTLLWNNNEKKVYIYRGKYQVSLKLKNAQEGMKSDDSEPTVYLWKGRTILPLSYILRGLKVDFYWLPEHKTLLVYSGTPKNDNGKKVLQKKNDDKKVSPDPGKTPIKPSPSPSGSPSPSPVVSAPDASPIPDDLPTGDEWQTIDEPLDEG